MGIYKENFSLKSYNTFGIEAKAKIFISFDDTSEIIPYLNDNKNKKSPILLLGGGSNILFVSDFQGIVIHPENKNITVIDETEDIVLVKIDAGVIWDDFVKWSTLNNWWGVENLSLIPGTTGAVPVQNIGAYGAEIKDFIEEVEAMDTSTLQTRIFRNSECKFDYRSSIFKTEFKNKYIITSILLRLSKVFNPILNYGTVREKIDKKENITSNTIRETIISIRQSKLPDPKILPNAGSFFKNPVIEYEMANKLKRDFPDLVSFPAADGSAKVSAGWLIEKCGWKGKRLGDAGVYEKQALVLVNYGNASGKDILELSEKIKESVKIKFNISMEREVNVI